MKLHLAPVWATALLTMPTASSPLDTAPRSDSYDLEAPPTDPYVSHLCERAVIAEAAWTDLVESGCKLLSMMSMTDAEAATLLPGAPSSAESPWRDYPKDFIDWGYEIVDDSAMNFKYNKQGPHLEDAYTALGLDPTKASEGGPNVPFGVFHEEVTAHNGVTYEPTHAQFFTVVNIQDGVLVGWYKFGPKHTGSQQDPRVSTVPKLRSWADVAFLKWQHHATLLKKDASNLRYVFSAPVSNGQSLQVLSRALGLGTTWNDGIHCPQMEGWAKNREWSMDDDNGKAFLASPNGRGAALMLIMHKGTFGATATIDKVHVWCFKKRAEWELNWLFTVQKPVAQGPGLVVQLK